MPAKGSLSLTNLLFRGFIFLAPVAVTFALIRFAIGLADSWLAGAGEAVFKLLLPDAWLTPFTKDGVPGLGVALLVLVLVLVGALWAVAVTRRGLKLFDRFLLSVPVVRAVYSAVRKVANMFGDSDETARSQRVVFLDIYPETRVPGFVMAEVKDKATGKKFLVVAIPSKPQPTGATVVLVPEDKTTDAEMTPQEVLK